MQTADVVFVTNYCKPHVDAEGKQSSIVYKAGQRYKVPLNDEMKLLLERRNIYLADQTAPTKPPVMDAPINSERTDQEFNAMSEVIDRAIQATISMTPQQQAELARKKGWSHAKESK